MNENIDDKIYSSDDLIRIIKKYGELIRFLQRRLGRDFVNDIFGIDDGDSIVDIKRGLVDGSNRMFWDYLCATHGIMEDEMRDGSLKGQFDIHDGIGCTKLIFTSGKEVIFTRENLSRNHPKGVISLDEFFYALQRVGGIQDFTRISNQIYSMEVRHFNSEVYKAQKEKIMKSSRDEIIHVFNITDTK